MKQFKILNTNIENPENTHFRCDTVISSESQIFGEIYRCVECTGLKAKLISKENRTWIWGEIHG